MVSHQGRHPSGEARKPDIGPPPSPFGTAGSVRERGTPEDAPQDQRLQGDGRGTTGFFVAVSQGLTQRPLEGRSYEDTIDISSIDDIKRVYYRYIRDFDKHISRSIPGYREIQIIVARALGSIFEDGGDILDIGASEGAFVKTISEISKGRIRTIGLEPNFQMAAVFAETSVLGSLCAVAAFGSAEQAGREAWTEDQFLVLSADKKIPNPFSGNKVFFFAPDKQFNAIHEAMTFQFLSNSRSAQIRRVKEMLLPTGIFTCQEKVITPRLLNDVEKLLEYKKKYLSLDDIEAKARSVLEGLTEGRGMDDNLLRQDDLEKVLCAHFMNVAQYWDALNFKGYAGSDDRVILEGFLQHMIPTNTQYSTAEMPRYIQTGKSGTPG